MKLLYRTLIGTCAGIDEFFPSGAQDLVNSIGQKIGSELGKEFKNRKEISGEDSLKEILEKMESEFKLGDEVELEEGEKEFKISVKGCNVCPKKVGGYPIRKTACPVPGILRGILEDVKGKKISPVPELKPGKECEIVLKEK